MNASQIIGALGVEVRISKVSSVEAFRIGPEVGMSPSFAETRWVEGRPVVYWFPSTCKWKAAIASVLHEALHVVVGPDSFDNELELMAVEAEAIRCIESPEQEVLRRDFSTYGMFWSDPRSGTMHAEVTEDDAVFRSQEWRAIQRRAAMRGLLVRGSGGEWMPVFGLGPHPGWKDWDKSEAGRTSIKDQHQQAKDWKNGHRGVRFGRTPRSPT